MSKDRLKSVMLNARDSDSNSPLHSACKNNHANVVRMLIEFGADLSWRNMSNQSPFHVSCEYASPEIVEAIFTASPADTFLDWRMIESAIKRDDAKLIGYLTTKDLSRLERTDKDGGVRKLGLEDMFDEALRLKSIVTFYITKINIFIK